MSVLKINAVSHFSNNVYFYWLNAKALLIIEYFKCVEFLISPREYSLYATLYIFIIHNVGLDDVF